MFWSLQSSSEFLGVLEDSKIPLLEVWVVSFILTLASKWGCDILCFQRLFNLGVNNFSLHFILVQTLHLTGCTLPYTSTIDLVHGSKLAFQTSETFYLTHILLLFPLNIFNKNPHINIRNRFKIRRDTVWRLVNRRYYVWCINLKKQTMEFEVLGRLQGCNVQETITKNSLQDLQQ